MQRGSPSEGWRSETCPLLRDVCCRPQPRRSPCSRHSCSNTKKGENSVVRITNARDMITPHTSDLQFINPCHFSRAPRLWVGFLPSLLWYNISYTCSISYISRIAGVRPNYKWVKKIETKWAKKIKMVRLQMGEKDLNGEGEIYK